MINIIIHNKKYFTPAFYICQCEKNFVHDSDNEPTCPNCGVNADEMFPAKLETVFRQEPTSSEFLKKELINDKENLVGYLNSLANEAGISNISSYYNNDYPIVIDRATIIGLLADQVINGTVGLSYFDIETFFQFINKHFWNEIIVDTLNVLIATAACRTE